MSAVLEGLDGVTCRVDDVLIHGRNHTVHDAHVRAVLLRIQRAGLTLNIQKCEFSQGRLKLIIIIIIGNLYSAHVLCSRRFTIIDLSI